MQRLTLFDDHSRSSRRLTHDSEYVSLTDLRIPVAKAASGVFADVGDCEEGDRHRHRLTDLPPLNDIEKRLLYRLQDSLLLVITLGAAVLACWACSQLYRGDFCSRPSDVVMEAPPLNCSRYENVAAFSRTGSPDLLQANGVFVGGWSMANTLLHVVVTVGALGCTAVVRMASKADAHRSVAWLWLVGMQFVVIFFDAQTLRKWKHTTCQRLQESIATSNHSLNSSRSARCDYEEYEAFVFSESLLAIALLGLVLLEPVMLRLWCSRRGSGEGDVDVETRQQPSLYELLLLQDDDAVHHKAYRKL